MKRFSALFVSLLSLLLAFPAVVKAADPSTPGVVGTVNFVSKTATSVTISWSAPSDTGMLSIDDYLVQFKIAGGNWSTFADGVSTTTSASVAGLTRGSSYSFRVAAVNALGQGPYLEHSTAIIPAVLPAAPSSVTVLGTHRSNQYSSTARSISWVAPDDGGRPILDYRIQIMTDGLNWVEYQDGVSSQLSASVTVLNRGEFVRFRVAAENADGIGPWSSSAAPSSFRRLTIGRNHACVLSPEKKVACWGTARDMPSSVGGFIDWVNAPVVRLTKSDEWGIVCAIRANSSTTCWGHADDVNMGYGSPHFSTRKCQWLNNRNVGDCNGLTSIYGSSVLDADMGRSSCAIIQGLVRCWGNGGYGSTGERSSSQWDLDPKTINGLDNAQTIDVIYQASCAISSESKAFCWGHNGYGQLGQGTSDSSAHPVPVEITAVGPALDVQLGERIACALATNGEVFCWGSNQYGDIGNGLIQQGDVLRPEKITGLPRMVSISVGTTHTCGVSYLAEVWCWGRNTNGQIGNGSLVDALAPVKVEGLSGVTEVVAGFNSTCALTYEGNVYCLGDPIIAKTTVNALSPVLVSSLGSPEPSDSSYVVRTVPKEVANVEEVAHSENAVNISWQAPSDDGGASVLDYVIQYSTGSTWTTFADGVSSLTSTTVTGLPRGISYQFRVAAVNSLGQGAYSVASGSSMPAVVPRAPLSLKVARWTGGYKTASADLSWTPPDNGGQTVTDFNIEYRVSGGLIWSNFNDGVSTSAAATITGLTRESSYEFRVRAVNSEGAGPWTYSSAESISAGGSQACATQVNGQTKCWGANASGQLGDGSSVAKSAPTNMLGTTRGVSSAVGTSHSCVLTALSHVYCVGSNSMGQLGDGTGVSSTSLVQVAGLTGVTKIAAGGSTTCAILSTGAVKCWGAGTSGQLGNGTTNDSLSPVSVTGVSGATAISVGTSHSCALVASGAVQCWGNNASGQLGNNTTTDSSTAVSVASLSGAVSISAGGSSTCAVLSTGLAKCWGSNASKQLGNASSVSSSTPVSVSGISTAVKVVSGSSHSCVLLTDSSVRCWGNNVSGQLGNGTTITQDTPVNSTGVVSAIDIAAGSLFTCVVESQGGVDCWGSGGSGQLGDGLSTSSTTSVSVSGIAIVSVLIPSTGPSSPLSLIETSHNDSQVTLNWSVPSDNGGSPITDYRIEYKPSGGSWSVFVDGTSTNTSATVTGLMRGTKYTFRVTGVNAVEDGDVSLVSVEITPSVAPGTIQALQLLTFSNSSVSVSWQAPADDGGSPITDYRIEYKPSGGSWTVFNDGVTASTLAVIGGLQQGTLYSVRVSAINANGAGLPIILGSDVRPATFPGLVSGLQVNSYSSSAIQISWTAGSDGGESITDYIVEYSTGTTWTVLNDGVSTNASATISGIGVGQLVRIRVKAQNSVGAGSYASLLDEGLSGFDMSGHTCAVGASGSVWCSGQNSSGQLGDGTTSAHYQFSRVSSISGATKVATGWDHSCAIVTLGAVKCWGANATGQLGDGTTTSSRRAVAVLGVSGAVEISAGRGYTCVVLGAGAAKCWGDNSQKQLGNNSASSYLSRAVDVSGVSTATKVAAAQYTACVLLADTTVQCWGDNRYGQVSNGGFVSPVAVPSTARFGASSNLQDVVSISSDPFADVFCVNTAAGSARCWGTNNVYQRGNNNTSSNPYMTTPNGLSSGVQSIEVGGGHACASLVGDVIKCWGYNVQGGASGGASRTNVAVPTTVTGASGSRLLLGLYSSCSYSNSSNWQCWGLNSSFERGDGGPDGGGPYPIEVSRQALLITDKPNLPSSVQVTSYSTSTISLSWAAPSSSGGVPIYDYAIEVKEGAGAWTLINDGVGTSTSYTWNSALKGSRYLFRVSAVNLSELSSEPVAISSSVIARVVPGSPTSVRETSHTDSSLTFAWDIPSDDGGSAVIDYKVEFQAAGGSWSVFNDGVSTATSATISGLTRGARYSVRVSAISEEGAGVPGLSEQIVSMSLGRHSCAVISSGQVACWGNNASGQIGVPPSTPVYQQTIVPGISNATNVEVGVDHTCALLSNQSVKCWGAGSFGQLGNGSNSSWSGPVGVPGLTGVISLSTGNGFTCAVKTDGNIWCWGKNDYWQVNNANSINSNVPVAVQGLTGAIVVESGDFFACAIIVNGQVSCWGRTTDGRLGNNTGGVVKFAGSGTALSGATSLSLNPDNSKACVVSIGSLRCWGAGFGNTAVYVTNLINKATTVSVGTQHVCATSNGGVACWGDNNPGALGSGNRTSISDWTVLQASPPANSPFYSIATNSGIVGIYSGYGVTCANSTIQMYCWGDNDFGQMARPISADINDDWLSPTTVASGRWSSPVGRANLATSLTETHSRTSVTLGWTAPSDTGGLPIYDYQIQYRLQSDSTWITFDDGMSAALSSSVSGLTNGQQYSFRIAPVTIEGVGAYSTEIAAYAAGNPTGVLGLNSPSLTATSFVVGWSAPADDGGRAITDYIVEYKISSASTWTVLNDGVSTATTASVTGLTRGTEYNVRVTARSANGDGVVTQMAGVVIPATVPAALSNVSISAPTSGGTLSIAYSAGDNGGRPLQGISYRLDSGSWVSGTCCVSPLVIPGLTNGTSYSIEVRVSNGVGFSPASSVLTATPSMTPSAPAITSIVRPVGGSQLSVAFTSGADNGAAITGYEFSVNGGSTWFARTDAGGTSSPLLISSLVNGTSYQVRLRAVNVQGAGTSSAAATSVPATTPGAPTITRLEPADGQLAVVIGAPASNGGASISNYEYSLDGGVNWISRTPASVLSPWAISGLSNGISYSLMLRAVNVQGVGLASTSVNGTPASLPSAPSITTIARPTIGQSLEVSFLAPATNGGAPLTTYQYSLNAGVTWTTRSDSQTTSSPLRISGLVNGNTYQVAIRALNAQGSGVGSSVITEIPAGVPTSPTISSIATPVDGSRITVSFSAASANGAEVSMYRVSLDGGSSWIDRPDGLTVESPISVGSLVNGQEYNVRIRGVNAQGQGVSSSAVSATPATAPDAPTITSLLAGESSFRITVRTNNTGGSPISAFAYSIDGGATWSSWSASSGNSKTVTASVGATYSVVTRVTNRQGSSPASSVSSVRIGDPPDALTTGASDVTSTTAILTGRVTANFALTIASMEVSAQSDFSSDVRVFAAGNVSGVVSSAVSVKAVDLREGTMYFYRVVASNSLGRTVGATVSFETAAPVGVSIDDGADYTDSPKVQVSLSWPRTAIAVLLSNDGGFKKYERVSLSKVTAWTLASTGNERLPKTIYVRYVMSDGSRSETFTDDIILDETDPTLGAVTATRVSGATVNALSAFVAKKPLKKPSVRMNISASDANSGLDRIEIKGGGKTLNFTVNPTTKRSVVTVTTSRTSVQVRSVDRAGNVSKWKTVKIPK